MNVKALKLKILVSFLLFIPFSAVCLPSETERKSYSDQIKTAFELQSIGESRKAFYVFKNAYQSALQSGMPASTLAPLQELFIWYRKYGFSCGLTSSPSQCIGEYRDGDWITTNIFLLLAHHEKKR